jgi:predicted permease
MRVNTPLTRPWTDVVRQRRLYDDLLASVAAFPGVERVAIGGRLPFDAVRGCSDMWTSDRPDETTRALLQSASEGFIAAIGARLVAGRDLAATDTDGAPGVVLVNEDLARALWPDQDPLGRVLNYQYLTGPAQATVIGVVASIRYDGPASALRPEAYITFRQARMLPPTLVVRSAAADPLLLVPHVKAALASTDPTRSVTLDQIQTLDARVARSFARPRFFLVLFGTFGTAAFLLAALGIYGTMTFWVNERWRELGIRLALGATRARVVRLVLTRGLTVASLGLGLGLIATVLGSRMLSTLLFDVTPTDPLSLVGALVSLSAIAVVACVLPARRVSRIDPALTLRD